ncbi:MAG TPA: peptide chain release factor N(5)-glutamine methyltransferase [Candidatus Methylomirabilis sp.]|nr:peptide chain release factor N(5)-glutamine methyltransferase [Candidatus Methylomirabilis sp.]
MTRTISEPSRVEALAEATRALESAGLERPRLDAEWLLASVLGLERFGLYLERARELSGPEALRYRALVARRALRVPLQHLLGFEEFHGVRLAVNPDVLIPRPETEGLVQWAIEIVRDLQAAMVLEIGTGSGAIACALARNMRGLCVLATDCSLPALSIAAFNVRALGLGSQVKLVAGDLLDPFRSCGLDLVVANPPYIPSAVVASLPPEVSEFEPRQALDGGPDGMAVIRRIIRGAPTVLRPGGCLLMEIGEEQAGPLASLLAAEGFGGIEARGDLAGRERYIAGRWPSRRLSGRPSVGIAKS